MSKKLTLSVVIPKDKIRKSLVLSLVDADSHFYSMRYKSLEFIIVDDSDESNVDALIESLEDYVPSVSKSKPDELHENISGEDVIVVHDESAIDYDALSEARKFLKEETKAGIISHKKEGSILDRITNYLIKILQFDKPIQAVEYPFLIYMNREIIKSFPVLESHSIVTHLDFSDEAFIMKRHDKFNNPSFFHYLKVWWHLISVKIKKDWKETKRRFKNRFKKYEK